MTPASYPAEHLHPPVFTLLLDTTMGILLLVAAWFIRPRNSSPEKLMIYGSVNTSFLNARQKCSSALTLAPCFSPPSILKPLFSDKPTVKAVTKILFSIDNEISNFRQYRQIDMIIEKDQDKARTANISVAIGSTVCHTLCTDVLRKGVKIPRREHVRRGHLHLFHYFLLDRQTPSEMDFAVRDNTWEKCVLLKRLMPRCLQSGAGDCYRMRG